MHGFSKMKVSFLIPTKEKKPPLEINPVEAS